MNPQIDSHIISTVALGDTEKTYPGGVVQIESIDYLNGAETRYMYDYLNDNDLSKVFDLEEE